MQKSESNNQSILVYSDEQNSLGIKLKSIQIDNGKNKLFEQKIVLKKNDIDQMTLARIEKLLKIGKLSNQEIAKVFDLSLDVANRLFNKYKRYGEIRNNKSCDDMDELGELKRPPRLTMTMQRLIYIIKNNSKIRLIDIRETFLQRYNLQLSFQMILRYLRIINLMKNKIDKMIDGKGL